MSITGLEEMMGPHHEPLVTAGLCARDKVVEHGPMNTQPGRFNGSRIISVGVSTEKTGGLISGASPPRPASISSKVSRAPLPL
jgi:hypothetical protein